MTSWSKSLQTLSPGKPLVSCLSNRNSWVIWKAQWGDWGHRTIFSCVFYSPHQDFSALVVVLTREGEKTTTEQLSFLMYFLPAWLWCSLWDAASGEGWVPAGEHLVERTMGAQLLWEWTLWICRSREPHLRRELRSQCWDLGFRSQGHALVRSSLPMLQSSPRSLGPSQLSVKSYSNVVTWFDLIWTESSSEFGWWLIHHFAVSLLKSSKWELDFWPGSGPRGSVFPIELTVSCAGRRDCGSQALCSWLNVWGPCCWLLLFHCRFTCGDLRMQGQLYGLCLDLMSAQLGCTPGNTKVDVFLRDMPSADPQPRSRATVLRASFGSRSVWSSLVALLVVIT